jgi:hypothetical protein
MNRGDDFTRFLRQLKGIVDDATERNYRSHGPMRVECFTVTDSKHKERRCVRIDSGWDNNYGGQVTIEASPSGKVLRVYASPEVKVTHPDA